MKPRPLLTAVWMFAVCIAFTGSDAHGVEDFSPTATYLFFVNGEFFGKSEIAVAVESERYVFTSTSEVQSGGQGQALSCRTEFDKATLRPLAFRYQGTQDGRSLSGTITFDPDSVRAVLEVAGRAMRSQSRWADGTMLFQNYVPEHLSVLARRLARSEQAFDRFTVLFPSDMMSSPAMATVESEVELAARPTPVVCKKHVVSIRNSTPFYLFVDSKRNMLVYMDFPASRTEVFLESVFGEHPATRYTTPAEPEGTE